jgi:Methyltransferase domain
MAHLRLRAHGYAVRRLSPKWRARRMHHFLELTNIREGMRIIDLGGTASVWELLDRDFHITLVNLQPNGGAALPESGRFTCVCADACDLRDVFKDYAFDFAFSNSTIEHVGDEARQEAFAREVRRLAPAYWVQTPSDRFPIEAHCAIPFYWQLPGGVRDRLMAYWSRTLPGWSEMMRHTCVLSRQRMAELFPDSKCNTEYLMGLEKSYAFYIPCAQWSQKTYL